jgi:hypothetical protein
MEPDPDPRGQNMGNKKGKGKKFRFLRSLMFFMRIGSFS